MLRKFEYTSFVQVVRFRFVALTGQLLDTGWTADGRNRTDCEKHVNDLVEVKTGLDGNALTKALKTFNQQYEPK